MESFNLGSDVYLEFTVKVNKRPALITYVSGELYRSGEYLRDFTVRHSGSKVSCAIDNTTFSTIGDYVAVFNVALHGMGMREHAIPFKIKPSVLGKKRAIIQSSS